MKFSLRAVRLDRVEHNLIRKKIRCIKHERFDSNVDCTHFARPSQSIEYITRNITYTYERRKLQHPNIDIDILAPSVFRSRFKLSKTTYYHRSRGSFEEKTLKKIIPSMCKHDSFENGTLLLLLLLLL